MEKIIFMKREKTFFWFKLLLKNSSKFVATRFEKLLCHADVAAMLCATKQHSEQQVEILFSARHTIFTFSLPLNFHGVQHDYLIFGIIEIFCVYLGVLSEAKHKSNYTFRITAIKTFIDLSDLNKLLTIKNF